ncbi:MAG: hypothetical protein QOE82_1532 [Thermoanaerobaculia bacterium]|nr:hypothetical protein [Thermoanaerobaculia bacterium]
MAGDAAPQHAGDWRRAVLPRHSSQRYGDLYPSHSRRTPRPVVRRGRRAAGGLRPYAHAIRPDDRNDPRRERRQPRHAVSGTGRVLASARAKRRAPPHSVRFRAGREAHSGDELPASGRICRAQRSPQAVRRRDATNFHAGGAAVEARTTNSARRSSRTARA